MHHDDFKFEPVRGLPEALPKDEHILWQGAPSALRLAKDAWKMNWIMGYFVVLALWRVAVSAATVPLSTAMGHGIPLLLAGLVACAIVYTIATVQARSTVYTLTNKRVAMRIGAALTMTLNLPYVCIGNANAAVRRDGHGTIAFELIGDTRFSHIMTWPHVRPWYVSKTQPAFRSIPDAARVAQIFADAAETRVNQPKIERLDPAQGAPGAVAAE
ncbi:photosynthetic complex putative assembly protein PuhB [Sulfitobacter sp. HNIBRBA3233]|uniref:photosynthetic complex putative assembly protein PuhB n=1 Tax=Sulfitobacter marinivivus TaxID=3158558 RepID=UPI0032DF6E3E